MVDDLVIRVITALVRVHEDLGPEAFETAATRSLLAIAQLRVEDAIASCSTRHDAEVIQLFPRATVRDRASAMDEPA